VRRRYLDAEDAYAGIVHTGVRSSFYELALYKLGWTFYKQELYENALQRFIALMDHKVSVGYDFGQTEDEQERKRTDDTFRVISLSYSNLGGANSVVNLLTVTGSAVTRTAYTATSRILLDKRRYADAAAATTPSWTITRSTRRRRTSTCGLSKSTLPADFPVSFLTPKRDSPRPTVCRPNTGSISLPATVRTFSVF